ncbi:hypothetical protein TNCV_2028201 [Trichonephila clavipes]|nr:hypothetical protein TNCV_2028201 [Trichonephila clavipes]
MKVMDITRIHIFIATQSETSSFGARWWCPQEYFRKQTRIIVVVVFVYDKVQSRAFALRLRSVLASLARESVIPFPSMSPRVRILWRVPDSNAPMKNRRELIATNITAEL